MGGQIAAPPEPTSAELTQQPAEDSSSPYERLPISALVEAAGELYHDPRVRLIFEAMRRGLLDPDEVSSIEIELRGWIGNEMGFDRFSG